MNVNLIPPIVLGVVFVGASCHIVIAVTLGARRWWRRRMAEPVYTYGQLTRNSVIDLTRADYDALIAQGQHELADAVWDAEIDQAQPRPDFGPIAARIAANEAARDLTDDRLRDWVEGK